MFKPLSRVLLGFIFYVPTALAQSNVVCTPDVPPATCKAYSLEMNWSVFPALKNVEILIADPKSFTTEEKKIDDIIANRTKAAKTIGEVNKAGGLKVGNHVFSNVFMEADDFMIKKVVVSTDRREIIKSADGKDIVVSDEDNPQRLSGELLYFIVGFYEGAMHEARAFVR